MLLKPIQSVMPARCGKRSPAGLNGRGFSLIELLAVIGIIALIAGILLVSYGAVTRSAEAAASRAAVTSVAVGVETFKTEFGFLPPLIRDDPEGTGLGPLVRPGPGQRVLTSFYLDSVAFQNPTELEADYRVMFGETFSPTERHFSVYSLSYYLVGALPGAIPGTSAGSIEALDGVDGPGFFEPDRSGGWRVSANIDASNASDPLRTTLNLTTYQPFVDADNQGLRVQRSLNRPMDGLEDFRLELAGGDSVPIRYYRWLPGQYVNDAYDALDGNPSDFDLRQLNVPDIFGLPENDELNNWWDSPMRDVDAEMTSPAFENAELRGARWAVVAAGPNGVFGDEVSLDGNDGSMTRDEGYPLLAVAMDANEARLRADQAYRAEILRRARADNIFTVGKP